MLDGRGILFSELWESPGLARAATSKTRLSEVRQLQSSIRHNMDEKLLTAAPTQLTQRLSGSSTLLRFLASRMMGPRSRPNFICFTTSHNQAALPTSPFQRNVKATDRIACAVIFSMTTACCTRRESQGRRLPGIVPHWTAKKAIQSALESCGRSGLQSC